MVKADELDRRIDERIEAAMRKRKPREVEKAEITESDEELDKEIAEFAKTEKKEETYICGSCGAVMSKPLPVCSTCGNKLSWE